MRVNNSTYVRSIQYKDKNAAYTYIYRYKSTPTKALKVRNKKNYPNILGLKKVAISHEMIQIPSDAKFRKSK